MCPVHIRLVKPSCKIHEVRPGIFVVVAHRIDKNLKGRWYRSKEWQSMAEAKLAVKKMMRSFRRWPTLWWIQSAPLDGGWQEFDGELLTQMHMQEVSA
jgi:hypothetical protein